MVARADLDASELVFVGYGVQAPEFQWDDYKGVDLRGKTMVVLVGDPPVPDPTNPGALDPRTFGGKAMIDFVNAMRLGISPRGTHYFPAFPYASYRSMTMADLLDLRAYLMSLPAVKSPAREATLPMVALARRGVGLWKRVAFRQPTFSPEPGRTPSWKRGAYLANAPGHCGECHTPKDFLMVADASRHMAGGPHPGGEGKVPSLRGLLARKKYKDVDDLVLALQNGETFGYEDLSSGGMAAIQENLARLPESDVRALSRVPAQPAVAGAGLRRGAAEPGPAPHLTGPSSSPAPAGPPPVSRPPSRPAPARNRDTASGARCPSPRRPRRGRSRDSPGPAPTKAWRHRRSACIWAWTCSLLNPPSRAAIAVKSGTAPGPFAARAPVPRASAP